MDWFRRLTFCLLLLLAPIAWSACYAPANITTTYSQDSDPYGDFLVVTVTAPQKVVSSVITLVGESGVQIHTETAYGTGSNKVLNKVINKRINEPLTITATTTFTNGEVHVSTKIITSTIYNNDTNRAKTLKCCASASGSTFSGFLWTCPSGTEEQGMEKCYGGAVCCSNMKNLGTTVFKTSASECYELMGTASAPSSCAAPSPSPAPSPSASPSAGGEFHHSYPNTSVPYTPPGVFNTVLPSDPVYSDGFSGSVSFSVTELNSPRHYLQVIASSLYQPFAFNVDPLGWQLSLDVNNQLYFVGMFSNVFIVARGTTKLQANTPYCVAFTIHGNQISLYLNGNLEGTFTGNGTTIAGTPKSDKVYVGVNRYMLVGMEKPSYIKISNADFIPYWFTGPGLLTCSPGVTAKPTGTYSQVYGPMTETSEFIQFTGSASHVNECKLRGVSTSTLQEVFSETYTADEAFCKSESSWNPPWNSAIVNATAKANFLSQNLGTSGDCAANLKHTPDGLTNGNPDGYVHVSVQKEVFDPVLVSFECKDTRLNGSQVYQSMSEVVPQKFPLGQKCCFNATQNYLAASCPLQMELDLAACNVQKPSYRFVFSAPSSLGYEQCTKVLIQFEKYNRQTQTWQAATVPSQTQVTPLATASGSSAGNWYGNSSCSQALEFVTFEEGIGSKIAYLKNTVASSTITLSGTSSTNYGTFSTAPSTFTQTGGNCPERFAQLISNIPDNAVFQVGARIDFLLYGTSAPIWIPIDPNLTQTQIAAEQALLEQTRIPLISVVQFDTEVLTPSIADFDAEGDFRGKVPGNALVKLKYCGLSKEVNLTIQSENPQKGWSCSRYLSEIQTVKNAQSNCSSTGSAPNCSSLYSSYQAMKETYGNCGEDCGMSLSEMQAAQALYADCLTDPANGLSCSALTKKLKNQCLVYKDAGCSLNEVVNVCP